ncbi:hypothetical protein HS1genome_1836 [Sulfodiicoccus acidiphilus]|uniref:TrmB family transcriptional regulator n=1 Tax=Sulfodiicoccus acidiphilus TaxID=1670455 RepID=A0A348B5J5_9CREN|nr:TrmB family transcriptional regulator [Sulfodiicoccus acidiphilus]BBD73447.1 hypothetical protein HS1genome_1836 [Sulfodiicoccus acidiphilus]GGT98456.1 hypothetical protein GCM10007116_14840 [Sulfodiicoccus acidiphilus]
MGGELEESLTYLGLSRREASVLAYLMEHGSATAKDMISGLSIHQPQLYNVLASLVRKGFVNVQESKPKLYVPERPSVILERLEREYSRRKKSILEALSKGSGDNPTRRNLIWVTRGMESVIDNSNSLVQDASNELYIETTPQLLRRLLRQLRAASSRGVKAYVMLYPSAPEDLVQELRESGVTEVRANQLGQFYLVAPDVEQCVFMPRMMSLSGESTSVYGYVFKDKFMTLFFLHYYFEGWRNSTPVFRRGLRPEDFPVVFFSHRFATWEIMKALEAGLSLEVEVEGEFLKGGERAKLRGVPSKVNVDSEVINFELLDESSGRKVLVGGENSLLEDFSAERIVLSLAGDGKPRTQGGLEQIEADR